MYKFVRSLSTSASPLQGTDAVHFAVCLNGLRTRPCTGSDLRPDALQFPVIKSGSSRATSPGAHRRRAMPQSRCELRCAERWRGPRVDRGPCVALTLCVLVVDDTNALRTDEGLNRKIHSLTKAKLQESTTDIPSVVFATISR